MTNIQTENFKSETDPLINKSNHVPGDENSLSRCTWYTFLIILPFVTLASFAGQPQRTMQDQLILNVMMSGSNRSHSMDDVIGKDNTSDTCAVSRNKTTHHHIQVDVAAIK